MAVLTNTDFANEVKIDRLKTMCTGTLLICGAFILLVLTFGVTQAFSQQISLSVLAAGAVLVAGSLLTRVFLNRNRSDVASWIYTLGGVAAVTVMLLTGDETSRELFPFVLPILVFIIGLLVSPVSTVWMTILCAAVVIIAPWINTAQLMVGAHQIFAIFLMILSALFSSQVSGELYAVTQWALMNYQRERKTNDELFEKRQELTMSLKRSEILSDDLLETNEELESAKQAADDAKNFRGQFLANMSHELRTPLNAIIGFSETMLQFPIMYDDEVLPVTYERDLTQIYSSGRQLLHVINDILDLAKVDAGKLEVSISAVDPLPLILAAMSTTRGLLGSKPVQMEKQLPEELPLVWADETRLRQVLLNLYSNAAKYTDRGSIRVTTQVQGDELIIAVRDTGVGVDPEYQGMLFQEFQQAKAGGRDARSGSGLGLAISRQLLELMGGRIWMESQPGVGSIFSFALLLYKNQDGKQIVLSDPIQIRS